MVLTEKGRFLWEKADEIVEKLNELDMQMENMCKSKLSIGISPVIKEILAPQIFPAFCGENPDILVHIATVGSIKSREMIRDGQLDMALVIAEGSMDGDLMQYELGYLAGMILREQVSMRICLLWRKDGILRNEEKRLIEFAKRISPDLTAAAESAETKGE